MNCKTVEDLLPLYIDHLCNEDNKKLIEEHLKTCESCQSLLADMSQNSEGHQKDLEDTQTLFNEKEVLKKLKKEIKCENVKRIFKVFFIVLSTMNVIGLIALIIVTIWGYEMKYPHLYFGSLDIKAYLILFIGAIVPLIFSGVGFLIIRSKSYYKKYIFKNIAISIILILSMFISIVSGGCLLIIPPVESTTTSTDNYLKVDEDLLKYKRAYTKLFPETIPKEAEDVVYSYRKNVSLFETSAKLTATWTLPQDSYSYYKQKVVDEYRIVPVSDYGYKVMLLPKDNRLLLELYFQFDDASRQLSYTAIIDH